MTCEVNEPFDYLKTGSNIALDLGPGTWQMTGHQGGDKLEHICNPDSDINVKVRPRSRALPDPISPDVLKPDPFNSASLVSTVGLNFDYLKTGANIGLDLGPGKWQMTGHWGGGKLNHICSPDSDMNVEVKPRSRALPDPISPDFLTA